MKIKKIYFIIFIILFWILLFSNNCYAGTVKWNSIDYDVTLNSDGSMDVVETLDVYASETNTLFKDFKIDKTKYSSISNVSVMEISPNEKKYEPIYKYKNHVDSGCFYALEPEILDNMFEIAWNIGFDNSSGSKVYKIKYRVNDVVKVYNDCAELYWEFVDSSNSASVKNVTGRVKLPKEVSDIEKLRVWGHGQFNANINKKSKKEVEFDCNNFLSNTMFEIRIVTDENIYSNISDKISINKLDSILKEETKWANEANAKRARYKTLFTAIYVIMGGLIVFFISKWFKYNTEGNELLLKYKRTLEDLKYFREIPSENATPARAAYLYYLKGKSANLSSVVPQLFSATMLNLALKKYIEFEPIDKKNFTIIFKKSADEMELSEDERIFFTILQKAAGGNDRVTTKELLKYSKVHFESLHSQFEKITDVAAVYHRKAQNFDTEREEVYSKWASKSAMYIALLSILFILALFVLPIVIAFVTSMGTTVTVLSIILAACPIILAFKCSKNAKLVSVLSDKGEEEMQRWKGLKNYMTDFSLLKEKEVPDLILWEQFLVYATAFGISKEVIKQLKIVYPEMSDPNYYNSHNYSYMYYMTDSRFGDNFVQTFDNMMTSAIRSSQNAYNAAHSSSSSGSGGGGGFSGGGGGGGGGGGYGGR